MKSLVFNVYFLFSYFILALFKIMKIKERCIGCRNGAGLVRGGAYSSNTVLRKSKAFRFLTFLPTGIKEKKRLGPVALFKISKGWKTKKRNSTNTHRSLQKTLSHRQNANFVLRYYVQMVIQKLVPLYLKSFDRKKLYYYLDKKQVVSFIF